MSEEVTCLRSGWCTSLYKVKGLAGSCDGVDRAENVGGRHASSAYPPADGSENRPSAASEHVILYKCFLEIQIVFSHLEKYEERILYLLDRY